jgi:hypothetical protein
MAKKHVSHYFDIELIKDIERHAKYEGRSRTGFIANAVTWYIKKVNITFDDNSASSAGEQLAGDDDRP